MKREVRAGLYGFKQDGALTLCLMVAKETDCRYDPGSWATPFYFLPETQQQQQAVTELLDLFEMPYGEYPTKEMMQETK